MNAPWWGTVVSVQLIVNGGCANPFQPLHVFMSKYPVGFHPWGYEQDSYFSSHSFETHPWLFTDDSEYAQDLRFAMLGLKGAFFALSGRSLDDQWRHASAIDPTVLCELFYHGELFFLMNSLVADVESAGFLIVHGVAHRFANLYRLMKAYPGIGARLGTSLFNGPRDTLVVFVHQRLNRVFTRTEQLLQRSHGPGLHEVISQLLFLEGARGTPDFYMEVLSLQITYMLGRILDILNETNLEWVASPVVGRLSEFSGAYHENQRMAELVIFNHDVTRNLLCLWERAFTILAAKQDRGVDESRVIKFIEPYLRSYVMWYIKVRPDQVDSYCKLMMGSESIVHSLRDTWHLEQTRYGDFWRYSAEFLIRQHCPDS